MAIAHAKSCATECLLPSPVRVLIEVAAPGPSPLTACTVMLYTLNGCSPLTVVLNPVTRTGCWPGACTTKCDTGPPGLRGGAQDSDNEVGVALVTWNFSGGPDTASNTNGRMEEVQTYMHTFYNVCMFTPTYSL